MRLRDMESVESWKMDFLPLKVRILKVENREEWAYLLAKQQNALGRESAKSRHRKSGRKMSGFYLDILSSSKRIQEFSRADYLVNQRLPLSVPDPIGKCAKLSAFFMIEC